MSITKPEGLDWLDGVMWAMPQMRNSNAAKLIGFTPEGWFVQAVIQLANPWNGDPYVFVNLHFERESQKITFPKPDDFSLEDWVDQFMKDGKTTMIVSSL